MSAPAITLPPRQTASTSRTTLRTGPRLWRRLLRNRSALVGGVVLVVIVLIALSAPLLAPYDPIKTNQRLSLTPPSSEHLMGTDRFGRDIFSRVIWAGQASLPIGL